MQKVTIILMCVLTFGATTSFKTFTKEKIQWLTVAEMQAAYARQPKPILLDVYTSWCGWCKVMDKKTYSNEKVATYINEHYYAVKLDAERKDAIEWNGRQYKYNAANKVNDFAVYLLGGQMSFPTTVFLPEINAQPAALAGYLNPAELESPLKYFEGDIYKSQSFQTFMKSFTPSWQK